MSIEISVTVAAAVTSAVLGGLGLWRAPTRRLRVAITAAAAAFAVESVASYMLLAVTELPEERLLWLQVLQIAGLVSPVAWGIVLALACQPFSTVILGGWRLALGIGLAMAAGGTGLVLFTPTLMVSDLPGPFYAVRLDQTGQYVVVLQILQTVGLLAALENALRVSRGEARWRLKYLILGLGGIFIVRFYLQSHMLLFHVLLASYVTTQTATLIAGGTLAAVSLMRMREEGVPLTISRHIVYRSMVIGVLGLYLFAVGALSWVLTSLGIAEDLFWMSLAVFVSALGLAIVLLSEDARWRVKRFIARHFYRSKYDYREHWMTFTKRLSALSNADELGPQLLDAVLQAMGATRGALYLVDAHDDSRYHLAAATNSGRPAATLPAGNTLVHQLSAADGPLLLDAGGWTVLGPDAELGLAAAAVPLRCRAVLSGIMLVGLDRTGTLYTTEDLEFLATVGEQAAIAVVSARQSERLTRAREFEAFHRVTSFVMHDLKNATAALSMLSDNAARHLDDPEFQRDALRTAVRTADRMKQLLARFAAVRHAPGLERAPVDLAAIVDEVVAPLAGNRKVTLVRDLAPVPAVVGDAEALAKVVQNLVTNAVEAVHGEGVVAVKTYVEEGQAAVAVSDTGCGMSEEFVQRELFTPFRSTKDAGWGIGLFQSKAIVEAHGGRIDVASKEGEGTTFRVRLPVQSTRLEAE